VLAGRVYTGPAGAATAGVTAAHSLVAEMGGVDAAMARPAAGLRRLANRLARQWSR
jgi:glycerate kinase